MAESLNQKIVKGISWSAVETILFYLIKFVIGVILARLLSPSDFGILGIIMVFISISDTLVDAGFGQAYIHKKYVTDVDANTVFACNFMISLAIYIVLFCAAPFLAKYYNYPLLTWLIRISSIVIVIHSLTVIQNAMVRREFLFRKRAIIYSISAIVSGIVGIICAYRGMGIWSLVIQQILQKTLISVLLYVELKWSLSINFSRQIAVEMFNYGFWVFLSNSIATGFSNVYNFSIGKLFPVVELGYYERSRQFSSTLSDVVTGIIVKVAFPAYSRIQDDHLEIKRLTCQFVKFSMMIISPLLAVLYIIAEPLIKLLLTEKWLIAAEYLQLMCLVGFLTPFYCFVGPLLQATKNLKMITILVFVLGLLRITNVICFYQLGVSAIIIGESFCLLFYIVLASIIARRSLGFYYLEVGRSVWKIVLFMVIAWLIGSIITDNTHYANLYIQIALPSSIMLLTYLSLLGCFEKQELFSLYNQLRGNNKS